MSWNFTHTGTRAAVAAKVALENYVPTSVKAAIADVIKTPTAPSVLNGVKVYSHGHVDSGGGSLKIEIEQVNLVLDEPVPETTQAPATPPGVLKA